MLWLLRIPALLLLLATIAPLLSTGRWYVRLWDFPRFQLAVLLSLFSSITACTAFYARPSNLAHAEFITWTVLLAFAFFWQVSHIIRFSKMWPKEVADSPSTLVDGEPIKFMVANLNFENPSPAATVSNDLQKANADVLLLIELNEKWHEELASLRKTYPYCDDHLSDEGLGISVWSKLKLKGSQTRFLVSERRASLWTTLETTSGKMIHFVGLHPTPPGLLDSTGDERRDSRVRDAELILVAKAIAEQRGEPWIVAGDFNDVAWSHTTRLFKRISGLSDPRIGRSLMGTFIAQYPILRCPIDHIFVSRDFDIKELSRQRITGSDHFAVLATVTYEKPPRGVQPRPTGNDPEEAEKLIDDGFQDAKARGVETTSE